MKNGFLLLIFVLLAGSFSMNTANAQVILGLPYVKIHTENRKPVPYQYVREADVMWSKIIYRQLELSEKMNHHFYFPIKPMDGRFSLIDLLLEGVHTQGLTAYWENGMDEFGTILTEKEVHEKMGAKQTVMEVETLEGGTETKTIDVPYNSTEVKRYLLKELWFFDKQRSVMEVRIIGICPIRVFYRDEDQDQERPIQQKAFWIYYPEARKLLASSEVFNEKNDALRLTFEDVFQKRFFASFIFAESNVYNNRLISEYTMGLESLLEAERIKENIFNFEQDLWEY